MNNSENISYPVPKQEYKVIVTCFTYNHSKYIEDTLNGFALQQTNFPYICFILDDASIDGEQDVIKSWMEKECDMAKAEHIDIPTSVVIIVPHKTNASCTFAFYLLKQNLYGTGDKKMNHLYPWREKCEYEALCEGDDYWTDSEKLQLQVDFLDKYPKFSFTAHRCLSFDETLGKWDDYYNTSDYEKNPNGIIIHSNYKKYITHTATLLYRNSVLSEYNKFVEKGGAFDFVLVYFLKKAGNGFCFNRKMSVRRLNNGGIYGKQPILIKLNLGYNTIKRLHKVEKNNVTRDMYYSRYTSLFYITKGKILFNEEFELFKFLSISYYSLPKLFRLIKRIVTK